MLCQVCGEFNVCVNKKALSIIFIVTNLQALYLLLCRGQNFSCEWPKSREGYTRACCLGSQEGHKPSGT